MTVRVLQVMARSAGGIARHIAQVTEALDGRDDLVVDIAGPPEVPVPLPKPPLELTIPRRPFGGHRTAVARLRSLIIEGRYDVVHAHGLRAGIDAGRAARRHALVLCTVHNLVHPEIAGPLKARLYQPAERLVVSLTHHTFAVSEQIAAHLRTAAPSRAADIETLYLGVGEAPRVERDAAEVRSVLGVDGSLIVTVARLVPQKAVHVLIDALALLPADVRLAVLGEGRLEASLKAHAEETGVGERVHWLGFRRDVADHVAAADVFCLSSVWEGVPLAAQEAILLGTPVVATDVGGMPELITDRSSGRLVPAGSPAALADALEELLDSEELRTSYSSAALEGLRTRFSTESMLARLAEVYGGVSAR